MAEQTSSHPPLNHPIRRRSTLIQTALHFSERRLLLGVVDIMLINVALLISLLNRPVLEQSLAEVWQTLPWFFLLSLLWFGVSFFFDVYDLALAAMPVQSAWRGGGAALAATLIYFFIPLVTPGLPERRLYALLFIGLAVVLMATWRVAYALVLVQPVFRRRVIIVGAGWAGRTLVQAITESSLAPDAVSHAFGYHIMGFVDDDPAKQGQQIEGVPVLGNRFRLVELARQLQPDEIIMAINPSSPLHSELFQALLDCHELGVQVTPMTVLYEAITGRVPVEHAGRSLHVVLPVNQPAGHRLYLAARRLFDLGAALMGCVVVAMVAPGVWAINRLTAPGDIFFRQTRVGQGGELFQIVKFRTMVMDAEKATGAVWAVKDDPRVTPLGQLLRRTRLDELPQCWNILKGEMSLIGPRPERPEFAAQLGQAIPFYRLRHAVKPGITGWAQVKYRYGASVEDALVKLQYDLYYTRHRGFYLDTLILFKTVQVMLGLYGR